MPGIVLSKSRHQEITKRWLDVLGREKMHNHKPYNKITIDDLYDAALEVYKDDPVQRKVIIEGLLGRIL